MRLAAALAVSGLLHAVLLLWLHDPQRQRSPIVIEAVAVDLVFDEEAAEATGPVPPVTSPVPAAVEPPPEAVPLPPPPARSAPPIALPAPPSPVLPSRAAPPAAVPALPPVPPAPSDASPLVTPAPALPPAALAVQPGGEELPPSAAAVPPANMPLAPPALPERSPEPPPVAIRPLAPPAVPPPLPDPGPARPPAVAALPAAAPEAPDQPAAVPAASEDALPPPPPPAMPTFRLSAGLEALSEQRPRRAGPAGLSRGPVARDTGCGGAFAYPEAARRLGAQGSVLLRIAVGADGVPISAEVVQGSGFPVLDRAARQAALRCRFDPALDGGRPVAGVAPWRVTYRVTP